MFFFLCMGTGEGPSMILSYNSTPIYSTNASQFHFVFELVHQLHSLLHYESLRNTLHKYPTNAKHPQSTSEDALENVILSTFIHVFLSGLKAVDFEAKIKFSFKFQF